MYRPSEAGQMTTACRLQAPTTAPVAGVNKKTYHDVEGLILANFKTYGGTETTSNGALVIEDTAQFVCWYRPDIKAGCRIVVLDPDAGTETKGKVYEIIGEPENIENRFQFLKFKGRRVIGGA